MSREAHVRFDGSGEGKFLPATLPEPAHLRPGAISGVACHSVSRVRQDHGSLGSFNWASPSITTPSANRPSTVLAGSSLAGRSKIAPGSTRAWRRSTPLGDLLVPGHYGHPADHPLLM